MRNHRINPKSKTSYIVAACLMLAALSPLAAQAGGSPPGGVNQTFTLPGICGFDVQVTITGKQGVVSLPSGGFIVTGPTTFGTFTNLSDPTKSVTLNITGAFHISFENGNAIEMLTGRNAFSDPAIGLLLLIGNFTLVFDSNGNLISGPTGTGQIINLCDLIN